MKRLALALLLLGALATSVILLTRLGAEASPATFTVNSTGDGADNNTADGVCDDGSGNCTLRAAIQQANASAGTDTIEFNIAGAGPHTISPGSALPTITDPLVIDGTSEPDFVSTPIVELDGSGAGAGVDALNITAGSSTVKGLVINRFSQHGIILSTNGGNVIQGNYIGTDVDGTADQGNGGDGLRISDAPDNTIGGTSEEARNVISGNVNYGIFIQYSGATGNVVQGNYIGTDVTGTLDLGNSQDGMRILREASYNTIGGTAAGAGNLISGNNSYGLVIQYNGTTENEVQGNLIGTDITGTAALANRRHGVYIVAGASNNHVGGTEAGAGNLISGNSAVSGSWGVVVQSSDSTGNEVQGNLIGTDITGTAALGNYGGGVLVQSPDTTIGGTTVGARNVISGNGVGSYGWGVVVQTTAATGNVVQGNYIGTDITGTLDVGNLQDGVSVNLGATNNTIGGTDPGAGNVVSGNDRYGVSIVDSGTTGNVVQGNYIGTDITGTLDVGNSSVGVRISQDAANNTIGSTASGTANTIAFNGDDGVVVRGTSTTGNTISANSIHSNGGKGIENTYGGNTELAPPIVDAVGPVSGHTDPKCYPCTVEVFSDNEDEGRIYHGSTTTNDDATGTWTYVGAVTGPNVTATVTDGDGNTSEFSGAVAFADQDGDTVADGEDNCPEDYNPLQENFDGDDWGDVCDNDDDNDGYWDADEQAKGSDSHDNTSTPEHCDGVDNDGDDPGDGTRVDEGWPDTDGDTIKDCVDPDHPYYTDDDDDDDGFTDEEERCMTTDEQDDCPGGSNPWDAPIDDAWPPDIDGNMVVDVTDALLFLAAYPSAPGTANYSRRLDMVACPAVIDVTDALVFLPHYPSTCTDP